MGNYTKNCAYCGKEFSNKRKDAKFCSHHCSREAIRTIPDKECPQCKKVFRPRNRNIIFCGAQCAAQHLTATPIIKTCAYCGKEFGANLKPSVTKGAMFCSTTCRNKSRGYHGTENCERCGKEYKRKNTRPTRFCSRKCRDETMRTSLERDSQGRKRCNYCHEWKLESEYSANPDSVDKLKSICKKCDIAGGQNRRARELEAEGSFTGDDVAAMFKGQGGRCWYCQANLKKTGYHVDHYIPLSKGGSNDPSNLRLACPTCNLRKSAKMPNEWEGSKGRLL